MIMVGLLVFAPIEQLVGLMPQLLRGARTLLLILVSLAMTSTTALGSVKSVSKVAAWVKTNAPRTYREVSWNILQLSPKSLHFYTILAKAFWIGACVVYGVMVLSAFLMVGPSRTVALHTVVVGLMAMAIIVIVDP
jgi:hypothetical protein